MRAGTKFLSSIAAVALLLLVVAILGQVVLAQIVNPYLEKSALIEQQRLALGKFMALDQPAGPSSQEVAGNNAEVSLVEFLAGETNAEAVAALQAKITQVAVTSGAQFSSASVLDEVTAGSLTLVGVNVQLSGGQEAIFRTLHALENQKPFLFLENGIIEADASASAAGLDAETALTVTLEIYGAVRGEKQQ